MQPLIPRRKSQPLSAAGDAGGAIIAVLLLTVALMTTICWTYFGAKHTLQYVQRVGHNDERLALQRHLSSMADCRRMLAPYTRTNICPAGTTRTLWLSNRATPEGTGGPGTSSWMFSSGQGSQRRWILRAGCGATSLDVRVALWNTSANGYAKDPLTGATLDFNASTSQLFGDGAQLPKLCEDYFGGRPPSRIYTMDMTTAVANREIYDSAGKLSDGQFSCDGTVGRFAAILPSAACRDAYDPTRFNQLCAAMNTQIQAAYDRSVARGTPDFACRDRHASCRVYDSFQGRLLGKSQCPATCAQQGYGTGVLSSCNGAAPTVGHGVLTTDASTGQVTCLCMR